MIDLKKKLFQIALQVLGYSGVCRLLAPLTKGRGVIFMLHQVGPAEPVAFNPNGILKITPEFLDQVIRHVRAEGYDIISLDELPARLANKTADRPFACFTLDDGYRDNLLHAYPVFKQHNVPFTVYLPSDYMDGAGDLWWLVLEESIRRAEQFAIEMDGVRRKFTTRTATEKKRAFFKVYDWLRPQPEDALRRAVKCIAEQAGYDASSLCSELMMTWDEVRHMAADPLVTFGGHTRRHMALAKLPLSSARREVAEGQQRLEHELKDACRHFAYPYGDAKSAGPRDFDLVKSLGFTTAVTTCKGVIHDADLDRLTSLPRLSLNGDYQDLSYVKILLTGVPFAIWNGIFRCHGALTNLAGIRKGPRRRTESRLGERA